MENEHSAETVFKENHGVWDSIPQLTITNSPYLIVISVVSYSIHPHYEGKGVERERSLPLVEHIFICLLISKITKNRSRKRGDGGAGGGGKG